jgi:hypothetical protein
MSYIDFGNN